MTIYTTAGTRLYIGGPLAAKSSDFEAADFASQMWVEIDETEGLGSAGDTSSEVTFDGINSGRTRRLKGTKNAGTMEVVCGLDPADPGQIALVAAERAKGDYAFRVVLADAPAGGTPSERMFVAQVGSASETYDSANSVMKFNATLWINSNIVKIDAA
ncbi:MULTISPECIES: hypothetical protein [unclassified Paracoccus (in: a-proteobacteria)]|jgi:hypothetical protein|uniref:hypothetical protein n=1 Tax=unclassified Paracoccus (in: a-proteobacteria) TaxID=2688777 RepID=UPI0005E0C62B|nr:hypothetical protein [Paracoccus sp. 228]KIX18483.1 hypothetical protein SY26_09450 [Paracoccus sp. 228]